jgi:drug/metabolite transporter (DMT)-like permease
MFRSRAAQARVMAYATILVPTGIVGMVTSQAAAERKFASGAGRKLLAPRARAMVALIAANIIWGTTFVATKPVLDRVPPLTIATARFAIALMVLIPFLLLTRRRPVLTRTTALMGFVGVFLVYACQNLGLAFTGATNGALIHGGIPALTMLIAVPLLGERLDAGKVTGLVVSLGGVAIVVLRGSDSRLGVSILGDGLVLLSALGLAGYLALGRRAFPGGGSLELVGGVAAFGLLFLLPASGVELAVQGMERPTSTDLLGLAYLGVAASALAFILWGYGLRHLPAGQAASFSNLNPFVGVIAAAVLLHEAIVPLQAAGGVLILGGVWLATRPVVAPERLARSLSGDSAPATQTAPALAPGAGD